MGPDPDLEPKIPAAQADHDVRRVRRALETVSSEKHEFLNGEVFAMAGGTISDSTEAGGQVDLASIGCGITVDDAYRDPLATHG